MSSLQDSYNKLTSNQQTVISSEENLLRLGRVFTVQETNHIFGAGGVLNFIMESPVNNLALLSIEVVSDSELYNYQFFADPTYTGGNVLIPSAARAGSIFQTTVTALHDSNVTDNGFPGSSRIVRGESNKGNSHLITSNSSSSVLIANNTITTLLRIENLGAAGELDIYVRYAELLID